MPAPNLMKGKIVSLLIIVYSLISLCYFVAFFLCKGSLLADKKVSDYIYASFQNGSGRMNDLSVLNDLMCMDDGDDVFFAKECKSVDEYGNNTTIYAWSSVNNEVSGVDILDTRISNGSNADLVLIDYYGEALNLHRENRNEYSINIQGKELIIDGTASWSPSIADEDGNFCSILMPYTLWTQYFDAMDVVCIKLNHISTSDERQAILNQLNSIDHIEKVRIPSYTRRNLIDESLRSVLYLVFTALIMSTYVISDTYQRHQKRENQILYYLGLSKQRLLFLNWGRLEIIVLCSITISCILVYFLYLLSGSPYILNFNIIDYISAVLILVIVYSFVNLLFAKLSSKSMWRL